MEQSSTQVRGVTLARALQQGKPICPDHFYIFNIYTVYRAKTYQPGHLTIIDGWKRS